MSDIRSKLTDEMAREIAADIDFDILSGLLVEECGWTKIALDRFKDNSHAVDIVDWLQDKCQGRWHRRGTVFVFELQKDATWFTLKFV